MATKPKAPRKPATTRELDLSPDKIVWHSPWEAPFKIIGLGWPQERGILRRMPLESKWALPEAVDTLAWHTAGIQIRFRTNSPRISIRVKLRGVHAMDHCAATGECGVDLYLGDTGEMTFAGVSRFNRGLDNYQVTIGNLPDARLRTITLNLPLYQGVKEISVGLPPGVKVSAAPRIPRSQRIVVYGTSITQGGCASRPGMAYTNILSRRINAEFINLGFSGSGRAEPEVAHIIATMAAPAVLVLDFEANCWQYDLLCERLSPFIEIIRKRWPKTEILLVSKIRYAHEAYDEKALAARLANRDFQKATVARLRRAGDKHITFLDGTLLLGNDYSECSVDGVHQTDLGFLNMANRLEKPLSKLLAAANAK